MRDQITNYRAQRAAWDRYYAACQMGAPEAERAALLTEWRLAWRDYRAHRSAGTRG